MFLDELARVNLRILAYFGVMGFGLVGLNTNPINIEVHVVRSWGKIKYGRRTSGMLPPP